MSRRQVYGTWGVLDQIGLESEILSQNGGWNAMGKTNQTGIPNLLSQGPIMLVLIWMVRRLMIPTENLATLHKQVQSSSSEPTCESLGAFCLLEGMG